VSDKRVVVTGMAAFTPISNTLTELWDGLMAGKSAISRFTSVDTSNIHARVGGDIQAVIDFKGELQKLREVLPDARYRHLRKIFKGAPFAARLGLLAAVRAWESSGLGFDDDRDIDPFDICAVLGGHNFNQRYVNHVHDQFLEEPEFIDGLYALIGLDTYIIASISDILGIRGPSFTVGGACASTNIALRDGLREIRHDGGKVALVAGAAFDFGEVDLQAMCLIDAITHTRYNDQPEKASRPYDKDREGFVPTWGCGTMVVEELDHAVARGATIHAEVVGVLANCDANHLPQPSTDGQARLMTDLLRRCDVQPEQIDYINAHATSTPMGDLAELCAIEQVFGEHAKKLKVNATKSMLGHTCWSAPNVESIAAIMQMNAGTLHQSINIDELDPEVRLDVCASGNVPHEVNYLMKNSFGFSGINCCSIIKRYEGPGAVERGKPF
jgi:3-oxoacyl-[acyl-carrier-protein] synthase I